MTQSLDSLYTQRQTLQQQLVQVNEDLEYAQLPLLENIITAFEENCSEFLSALNTGAEKLTDTRQMQVVNLQRSIEGTLEALRNDRDMIKSKQAVQNTPVPEDEPLPTPEE